MNIQKKLARLKPLPMNNHFSSFVSTDSGGRIEIQYYFDKESGHFYASVIFGEKAQGPPGHVHGGAIASVLDEAMGAAAWMNGFTVMTAKLEVSYFKALKLKTETFVETWVDSVKKNKIQLKGRILSAENTLFAESSGLFILKNKEHFQVMGKIPENYFETNKKE